jgi:hypothetical protein
VTKDKGVPDDQEVPEVPEDEEDTNDYKAIIENWAELNDIPLQDLIVKGWKPRIRVRPGGSKSIRLRVFYKDEEGKWKDSERSLGAYSPERWQALLSMFPKKEMYPSSNDSNPKPQADSYQEASRSPKSSVLATKVARVSSIGPTVHLELRTLQWYEWLRKDVSYPGTLDDFINQSVNTLFKEHYNLELAVIDQGEK